MKPDERAFIADQAANVKRTATGLEGSASIASAPSSTSASQVGKPTHKSFITISAYDARQGQSIRIKSSASPDGGIPVTLNAGKDPRLSVQIGCFSSDKSPNKLSVNQLKSFQRSPSTETVLPSGGCVKNQNRSVTYIGAPDHRLSAPVGRNTMMTMMTSLPAQPLDSSSSSTGSTSPNGSTKNCSSEMDNYALDSGTCSDLEINSSSSSLNNSITPPPPPLPKKMNKTKEKLKSENEKFFQLKNYRPSTNGATGGGGGVGDQDDNLSVLSCGSNNSNCSSISLISCDSLNAANRRLISRSALMLSPNTTTTSYSSDSPTPSHLSSSVGDPPVIVSDPNKQNAIVLSVKAAAVPMVGSKQQQPLQHQDNRHYMDLKHNGSNNGIGNGIKAKFLPTSLLADIRKRSSGNGNNGDVQKNVNVISIRGTTSTSSTSDGDINNELESGDFHSIGVGGGGGGVRKSNGGEAPEKYLTKKFINFSINSMMDEVDDETEDGEGDDAYYGGNSAVRDARNGLVKSAFASIDSRKSLQFENDSFYNFHINENKLNYMVHNKSDKSIFDTNEDSFAGYRDLATAYSPTSGSSTIRSNKGTIRGVKNRVRNGIATFLQMQHANIKNYKEKDAGKVVIYTTTMGIVRDTYAKCANVKQILRTLLVKFEERDVFMSNECQQEIKDRMQSELIKVPQLFVDGQYVGDADAVERLNESGELRKMLKCYQSLDPSYTCQACGGYRLLPCPSCNGSKKSVHRNHFTAEFIALKCMNCDEVGLVRCHNC